MNMNIARLIDIIGYLDPLIAISTIVLSFVKPIPAVRVFLLLILQYFFRLLLVYSPIPIFELGSYSIIYTIIGIFLSTIICYFKTKKILRREPAQ